LKAIVDKQDKTNKLIKKITEEYKDSQDREKVASREAKKADMTNYIQHYEDLFAIEEEFSETEYGSQKHLISLMYSKGLLNNVGKPILIPRNYFAEVELIENDKRDIIIKPESAGSGYNYYNYKTGRLLIQSYKTSDRYGDIDIKLSNYTVKAIRESIKQRPRKWLFTTNSNDKYSDNSSFGTQISNTLGITINQIRRAWVNYLTHIAELPRNEVAKLAKHSVETDEFTYSTIESNIARQNTIYDVKVIGKKVDVKITEGKYAGETLIGVVTRSLKPNRHAFGDRPGFAYLIKFDKNENGGRIVSDEMSNDIPNASEGITMHIDRPQRPKPRNRNGRNRR
jgi:hypothetical protein